LSKGVEINTADGKSGCSLAFCYRETEALTVAYHRYFVMSLDVSQKNTMKSTK